MVVASCWKNSPEMPEMKADGTNTAHSVRAMAIRAVDTSFIVLVRCMAARACRALHVSLDVLDHHDGVVHHDAHRQRQAWNSDKLLIDMPRAASTENVPTSGEIGMAITG